MNLWVVLSTVGFFFSLFVIYWVHNQYHLTVVIKPSPPPPPPTPLITVIVPARNEEHNIEACLHALLTQTYTNLDVVVVDDRSEDHTAGILARMAKEDTRVRIIKGRPLPNGWSGKSHALWQGAQKPTQQKFLGEWLCFVDADTIAAPDCIASVLQTAQRTQSDLLTLITDQRVVTFWEKTILPLVFTALSVGFSPRRVNNPSLPDAIANGQFLFFKRSAYDAIGGHRSVSSSIVEDRDLARQIKKSGFRLVLADGRAVTKTRMYRNFAEIWEGWTKNIFLGLAGESRLAWLGIFGALLCLLAALAMPAWWFGGLTWFATGGGSYAALVILQATIAWAFLLYFRIQACHAIKISPIYAFTLPIGTLILAAMMIASTIKVISGHGVTWKGRRYSSKTKR